MATTLDADQELLHFSFPIEKQEDTDSINPVDGTPDVWIVGKATDGTIDADRQIVDPEWSAVALREWAATGGNVRMAHDPKRPVGKGHDVQVTMDGHYVKSLISDPLAKHFIRTGVLNDYSVGISMPHIKYGPHKSLDPRGEATGGIITGRPDGLSKVAELSVVDRGSNFHSKFQITRKAAADGDDFGFIGKMLGSQEEITRAAPPDLLAKMTGNGLLTKDAGTGDYMYGFSEPCGYGRGKAAVEAAEKAAADLSITFTPADMARLVKEKFVQQHYDDLAAQAAVEKRDFDRGVGGGVDRDKLPDSDFAGPHRSFPIVNQSDVSDALHLAGHAADPDAVRARIRSIARRKGLSVPGDDDSKNKGTGEAAEPTAEKSDVIQDAALMALAKRNGWTPAQVDAIPADAVPGMLIAAAANAAKEAEPDLTKACTACKGGSCCGSGCSCGKCGDGKCCAPSLEKSAGEPGPGTVKKAAKKPKGKRKLPPWLNQSGSDDEKESSGDTGACKSAHVWEITDPQTGAVECAKCHTTPAQAAGLTAAHDMQAAPVGELMESNPPVSAKGATPQSASGAHDAPAMQPVARHREPDGAEIERFERDAGLSDGDNEAPTRLEAPTLKAETPQYPGMSLEVAAMMRFKTAGIDPDLGILHDLTCPAYHPDEVAKYHPFAEISALVDESDWQRKALDAACGPIENMLAMAKLADAARALKAADPADLNQWRLDAYKAFRDANPGPSTYPTPGSISPQKFNRPVLTDGRAANSAGYGSPNTAPVVATSAPNAHSFDRPPLTGTHASPSPSFMKADFPYPSQQGSPMQLVYARQQQEQQHEALASVHNHLASMFPVVCPMDLNMMPSQAPHQVPATAGIGKAAATGGVVQAPEPETADTLSGADITKGRKKLMAKLGKKVMQRKLTVDEASALMGNRMSRKSREAAVRDQLEKGLITRDQALTALGFGPAALQAALVKMGAENPGRVIVLPPAQKSAAPAAPLPPVAASFDPEVIKAAVADATSELKDLLVKQRQDMAAQQEDFTAKLADQQRVIDAIADQPDPSTAAFSGVAFRPGITKSRPAGVTEIADHAAHARRAQVREMEYLIDSASDPYQREAARRSLEKLQGGLS